MIRSMSYRRYFRIAKAMQTGRLNSPKPSMTLSSAVSSSLFDDSRTAPARPMTVATAPAISHLSWARRSPVARRQLST